MKMETIEIVPNTNEEIENVVTEPNIVMMNVTKEKVTRLSNVLYCKYIKNILDVTIALVSLILLSPIMALISIAIKLEDGGPVFFKQDRSGKGAKTFKLYKFRSMVVSNDVHDFSKENKYTKVGKFLRKTSLDELPQLINILRNEMSFIGPRPWIEDYNKYFTENQRRRLEVKPGLSGLAQTKNRNNITIQEKIQWDIYYVDHQSFIMDLKIMIKTFLVVFSKDGAEQPKSGIREELEVLRNQER